MRGGGWIDQWDQGPWWSTSRDWKTHGCTGPSVMELLDIIVITICAVICGADN